MPFLNFVRPKQMADDIWAANDLARTAGTRSVGTPPQKSGLVKAWWVAWVASTLVALFIPRGDPRTLDDLLRANALYLVRDGLLAVAAVLALVVVRRITADQAAVAAAHLEHAEPRRDGEPR